MIDMSGPWLESGERLVCLGDSLTASKTGYVALLAEALSSRGIEVVNAGRGGDKTPTALMRLQSDVIDRAPAAVSVFLGANDAAVGRGCWADEPTVTPEAYRCNLVWIMHACRLQGIEKFSVTPPLYRYEGDQYGAFGEVMLPYCQAARDAADAMAARFVPADVAFAEAWSAHPGHTGLLLTTDGVHLTPQGNRLLADTQLKAWGMGI